MNNSEPPIHEISEKQFSIKSKTIVGGAAITLVGRILAAAFGYLNSVLAARLLGPEVFGLYILAVTILSFTTILGSAGVDNSLLSLVPRRRQINSKSIREAVSFALIFVAIISVIITAFIFLFSDSFESIFDKLEFGGYLKIMILALPFLCLLQILNAASKSVFAFREAVLPLNIIKPVIVFAVYLYGVSFGGLKAETVFWTFTVAVAIAFITAVSLNIRIPEYGIDIVKPRIAVDKEILKLSRSFFMIQLASNHRNSVIIFVLGMYYTASEVGYYGAAHRTAIMVSFILIAVNTVFAPTISTLWGLGDINKIRIYFQQITRWSLIIALPVCFILIFSGPGVLSLFGPEYVDATTVLTLMAIGQLVNVGVGSVGNILMYTGHEKTMLWNTVIIFMGTFILSLIVVPQYGSIGAAAVGAITVSILNLVMFYQVWLKFKILPYNKDIIGVLIAGLGASIIGIVTYNLAWSGQFQWLLSMLISSGSVLGGYLVLLFFFALSKREKIAISDIVKSVGRKSQKFKRI